MIMLGARHSSGAHVSTDTMSATECGGHSASSGTPAVP